MVRYGEIDKSRSVRARGLKQEFLTRRANQCLSRSLRARGLKPISFSKVPTGNKVALFTGAWIETNCKFCGFNYLIKSRSLRARGLKLKKSGTKHKAPMSRSLRARGLKRAFYFLQALCKIVALFTGAWIETKIWSTFI